MPEKQRLTIKLFDKDTFTADDSLGFTLLPVSKLADGSTHELDLPLDGNGGGGRVQLSVTFSPFSGAFPVLRQTTMQWGPLRLSAHRAGTSVARTVYAFRGNDAA